MKALFTTRNDFSAVYFKNHNWDVFDYSSVASIPINSIQECEVVYFRDPFNDAEHNYSAEDLNKLIYNFSKIKSIDNIRSFDDMLKIEDKFLQAKIYGGLCPQTFLPSQGEFISGKHLVKKRISQRAKDVLFELPNPVNNDWIIQELLDIKEELRVYVIFGEVIGRATIKTSKRDGKVKVVGGRELKAREKDFCYEVASLSGLDFIGIDLAVLTNDDLKLIEVNRSPQFKRFVEIYGEESLMKLLEL